jgi:alpha-1,2-mannosyltransferase
MSTSKNAVLDVKVVFLLFAIANSIAALYAPIQDCDEVFNYWEPTHYLSHGYGLQTWEYSPEYAIRSWFYVALHAVIGRIGYLFSFDKRFEFYFLRVVLGLICAFAQTRLHAAISRALNPRVGAIFMTILLTSPGMFHAATAYLPSSFSMYTGMLGAAEFIDWRGGSGMENGVMLFGIGAIIGWPFSAALVIPFLINETIMASITDEWTELVRKVLTGTVRSTIALVKAAMTLVSRC